MKALYESIFDDHENNMDDVVYLNKFNDIFGKYKFNHLKGHDRLGRKLNIGDIVYYDDGGESFFIQIKDFDRYGNIIPTNDISHITGEKFAYSYLAILIPRSQYNNFLKVIKNNK